ncbi:hypothetical protein NQD34_001028 [Periophthalmus magnuspinnatus]|nr:hypothetical protein NQD34_001028 [Periophthalmus magnuspinnatus]
MQRTRLAPPVSETCNPEEREDANTCISVRKSTLGCWQCSNRPMYKEMMTLHVNNIDYKYLCINGLCTSKPAKGFVGKGFPKGLEEKFIELFPLHIQSLSLDPESCLGEERQTKVGAAPDRTGAFGVP